MGCGKNGTFDLSPDLSRWAIISVWNSKEDLGNFKTKSWINTYFRLFTLERWNLECLNIESHGEWDKKSPFQKNIHFDPLQPIGVLTRASIKPKKALSFWKNVPAVSSDLGKTPGLITSIGIGEIPFFKQATFSIWENAAAMKEFAYRQKKHKLVIEKTRKEGWYSEELFARFHVVQSSGTYLEKEVLIN